MIEKCKNRSGFTIVELIVVMAIIAVLSMLVIGAILVARRTATESTHRNNLQAARVAFETQYAKRRVYSCALTGGVTYTNTCNSLLGNPVILAGAGLTANDLTHTCYHTSMPTTPSYGVWVYGKGNPGFAAVETAAGLSGKEIILGLLDSKCTTVIDYVGLP